MRKGRIAHGASLTRFLIFCKRLPPGPSLRTASIQKQIALGRPPSAAVAAGEGPNIGTTSSGFLIVIWAVVLPGSPRAPSRPLALQAHRTDIRTSDASGEGGLAGTLNERKTILAETEGFEPSIELYNPITV